MILEGRRIHLSLRIRKCPVNIMMPYGRFNGLGEETKVVIRQKP
jgi:hypothetical protein